MVFGPYWVRRVHGQNGDRSKRRHQNNQKSRVKTTTGENGESQNGDKPYNDRDCVCMDINAISIRGLLL